MSGERVTVEFLRMQVAEHIPGAIAICAKSLDFEPRDLIRMAENGELTTDHLLPVMTEELWSIFRGEAIES